MRGFRCMCVEPPNTSAAVAAPVTVVNGALRTPAETGQILEPLRPAAVFQLEPERPPAVGTTTTTTVQPTRTEIVHVHHFAPNPPAPTQQHPHPRIPPPQLHSGVLLRSEPQPNSGRIILGEPNTIDTRSNASEIQFLEEENPEGLVSVLEDPLVVNPIRSTPEDPDDLSAKSLTFLEEPLQQPDPLAVQDTATGSQREGKPQAQASAAAKVTTHHDRQQSGVTVQVSSRSQSPQSIILRRDDDDGDSPRTKEATTAAASTPIKRNGSAVQPAKKKATPRGDVVAELVEESAPRQPPDPSKQQPGTPRNRQGQQQQTRPHRNEEGITPTTAAPPSSSGRQRKNAARQKVVDYLRTVLCPQQYYGKIVRIHSVEVAVRTGGVVARCYYSRRKHRDERLWLKHSSHA